jgi:lipopolysaccharide/colanic/teichoic acid biosynthesis glycosyltransferase/glycosyltransferase involved in cell wall biosynthesis
MTLQPKISIIIPAKNAARNLKACLHALIHQDGLRFVEDYEVILVNDGSSDETASIGAEMGIKVISQMNAGPAAARNAGAKSASGEILLFTDSDCVPQLDWCLQMLKPFADPDVVGVKGAYLCLEQNPVARFVQQEFEHKYTRMAKQPKIDFIDTYSAAYRKSIFLENGGFEERFPVPSVEDQEFSFRLARKGYHLFFQPSARVYHTHDLNLRQYALRKWGIGYWKAYMLRWLPEKTFSDTYTPASQRLQILLLAGLLLSLFVGIFWHWAWMFSGFLLFLFYFSASNLLLQIKKNDSKILGISLLLIMIRALTLGFGLLSGFLFPPDIAGSSTPGLKIAERSVKRLIDIFGGCLGLIISAPVVLVSMLMIAMDSKGKVIYSQERAGENGKPFKMYKLRTMVDHAEDHLEEVLEKNGQKLESPVFKIRNDPRVTRIGRFLRRWSLDETPQFCNILKGEMSLVGPRPEETWIVARYDDRQRQRLVVKPGLTGPMQISGRADLTFEERLSCELDYINNFSIWKDFIILWKSIGVIISGKGAF